MRKINVAFSNEVFTFNFEHKNLTLTLSLEEVAALDAVINTLNKTGVMTANPVIHNILFSIDIDFLFKRIDELFPKEENPKQLEHKAGHYV